MQGKRWKEADCNNKNESPRDQILACTDSTVDDSSQSDREVNLDTEQEDTTLSCSGILDNRKVGASNDPQALVLGVACIERPILNARLGEAENRSCMHSNDAFIPSELNKHNIGGQC
ncbi:hypothetical protein VNO77_13480 [Canavalia gladiata]|uniref:Uncharacterized protein n=1 Tax=Canavalia gladiata TaxID=3824 RepID=A0AAN9LY12_CANGL